MKTNPIFQFNTTTDTGIDQVPLDTFVLIKDSDGAGTLKTVLKIANTNMTGTSTIADFLADGTLFSEQSATATNINGGTY